MSANDFAFKFEKERDFLLVINSENKQRKIQPKNEEKQSKKNFDENVCGICEKKLKSKMYLNTHMKALHPDKIPSAVYSCDHCNKKFLIKFYLIAHLKSKHQKGKEIKFECDFDGKIFETKKKLWNHMRNHQNIKVCKICEKKVKNLKQHMSLAHAESSDKNDCQICNKTFKNQKLLNYHLKIHKKQHQCQVCGRRFPHFFLLNQHLKVHKDKFAFRCEKCQKNFASLLNLKRHLKIHDKNRSRPHKCHHCDYSADNKGSLKKHLNTHEKNREKSFKCSKCDYKTDQKAILKRHLQTHELYRRKFPCPTCNYEATTKSSLTTHIKRKHESNSKICQNLPQIPLKKAEKSAESKYLRKFFKPTKEFICALIMSIQKLFINLI